MAPATDNANFASARPLGALARLTLAELLRARHALLLAAVLLVPVAFALYWSLAETITGDALYQWGIVFVILYLNVSVPLSALLVGASLISSERESQTLVYLLTRPVRRWKVALTKFIAGGATCVAGITVSMALALAALALHARSGPAAQIFNWSDALSYWPQCAGIAAAALAAYLALFFLAGVLLRRAVALGVVFIVLWEGFVGFSKGVLHYATVIHYVRSLALHATKHAVSLPSITTVRESPAWVAAVVLASLTALSLALALWRFSRAEYPTTSDR